MAVTQHGTWKMEQGSGNEGGEEMELKDRQ